VTRLGLDDHAELRGRFVILASAAARVTVIIGSGCIRGQVTELEVKIGLIQMTDDLFTLTPRKLTFFLKDLIFHQIYV
jgi:hypothetical protein